MLRVTEVIDKRLTTISCSLSKNLAMTSDTNERDGDVEMQETQPRSSEENGRPSLPQTNLIRSSAPSTAERSEQDSQGSRKTSYTPHIQMLKPKNNAADQDVGDTSFGASSAVSESEINSTTSVNFASTNGVLTYSSAQSVRVEAFPTNTPVGESSMFGTFRSSIPQEVFEKIKERITASREREKQSVAKQILRKEEEKKKLAREQDVEDLESTIRILRENILVQKNKRQLIYTQLKQKMSIEEGLKRQISTRDRGREMSNHVVHHSYPNPTMLISQTNPSMRPRLMQNYVPINMPMNAMQLHQNNSHLDTHTPNMSKRQRSVSPGQIPGHSSGNTSNSSRVLIDPSLSHGRSLLQPPPNKMARPGAQTTPDVHGGSSQSSRLSVNKSPSKSQTSTPVHHNSQGGSSAGQSQQQQQPVTMAGPFAVASPYGGAMGNQVLCLIPPNMMGTAPNGQPQFINPAFLQKPEHLAALSQQQQQALMAQQLHAMGQISPEYFHRALQHLSDSQQRSQNASSAEANAALYRQYQVAMQAGALAPQQVLIRPGLQMQTQDSNSGSQSRPQHNSSNTPAPASHSAGGQNSDIGSQRVGGITSGQPVFGHAMAHPYGMTGGGGPGGGAAVSNSHAANMYPRTGASS